MGFNIIEEKELQGYITNISLSDKTKDSILNELKDSYDLEEAVIKNFRVDSGKTIITSDFNSDNQENILDFVKNHFTDGKIMLYELYRDPSKAKKGAREIFRDESEPWEELADVVLGKPYVILTNGKDKYVKRLLYNYDTYTIKKVLPSSRDPITILIEFDEQSKDYLTKVLDWQKPKKEIVI
ncbi:hypothetical protein GF374_02425 [Candidatus Woesearchaeota archaeon]|nr:hypothetical protein [Candidatus Woesearchaeota archaeon]